LVNQNNLSYKQYKTTEHWPNRCSFFYID